MNRFTTISIAVALSASGWTLVQAGNMKEIEMHKSMPMEMHKDVKEQSSAKKGGTHHATGIVKSVDQSKGTVTLSHEPVKSLKWPAMTMGFSVKEKSMLDKLKVGEKVNVEFMQEGSQYVVSDVK